jgi:hypothetical protein
MRKNSQNILNRYKSYYGFCRGVSRPKGSRLQNYTSSYLLYVYSSWTHPAHIANINAIYTTFYRTFTNTNLGLVFIFVILTVIMKSFLGIPTIGPKKTTPAPTFSGILQQARRRHQCGGFTA